MRCAGAVAWVWALLGVEASAAEPASWPTEGVVGLLPSGAWVQGQPAALTLLAVDAAGAPLGGLKLKGADSSGAAVTVSEVRPGVYQVLVGSAPAGEWTVELKGKLPDKSALNVVGAYESRAAGGVIGVSFNPTELVLGKGDGAALSLVGGQGSLAVRSSSGEVKTLTPMGEKTSARYEPPSKLFPALGIVTAVDAGGAGDQAGYGVVPLLGAVEFPVQTEPGASVLLRVADKEFGPVVADATGAATVPIIVPPGTTRGTQVSVVGGKPSESELDLKVPQTRTLALFPLPAGAPAGAVVPLRAVRLDPAGKPNTSEAPSFEADRGAVGPARHLGDGVWAADWTLPTEPGSAAVTVRAGTSDVQRDNASLVVKAPLPAPLSLSWSGEGTLRTATVPAPAQGQVELVGDQLVAKGPSRQEGGAFVADFVSEGVARARARLRYRTEASSGGAVQVVLVPGRYHLLSDGEDSTLVDLVAVDRWGAPVAGVDVTLRVEGPAKLDSTKVVTDANGLASLQLTTQARSGLVQVWAEGAGASGGLGLVVGPNDPGLSWAGANASEERWRGLLASFSVDESKGATPAVGPVPVARPSGLGQPGDPVGRIDLLPTAAGVAPGGTVTIVISALTAEGLKIPGQSFDLLTSGGEVSAAQESEPGVYRATLTAPKGGSGVIKVSALAGGQMGLVEVTIDPSLVATTTKEPKPPKDPKEQAPPKPAAEVPWLRARAGFVTGLYGYQQTPSEDPGPLLPEAFGLSGGSRAVPVGYDLDARVWVPSVEYLGFHASYRGLTYSIAFADGSAVEGEIQDWLQDIQVDVVGRYPFQVGSDQFWAGAKVGFRSNDFLVFTGCVAPGCELAYDPLAVSALALGVEAGAEVGPVFLIGGFAQGLASGSISYATEVAVDAGYQVHERVFLQLGFDHVRRRIGLLGEDSGELRGEIADSQLLFGASAGFSL